MPAGTVETRPHDSRDPWRNADPEAVVAASRRLGSDLPVDYEHQRTRTERTGGEAPAAGWITRLFVRDGAIWGAVEWTARAASQIVDREYRFISAEFLYRPGDRVVTAITGASLTNNPAFHMPAIARADAKGVTMSKKAIAAALGLPETATDEEVEQAALAAAAARTAASVDEVVKAGKLPPACRDAGIALATAAPAEWAALAATMPVLVEPGRTVSGRPPGASADKPFADPEVRAVATALGVTEEQYAASASAMAKARESERAAAGR